MKIVVLGATGKTGSQVVDQALAAGHEVTAYVRDPAKLSSRPSLSVVTGQLDDVPALTGACQGADAVVSCVGPAPSDLLRPHDLMVRTVRSVARAMSAAGVTRFVLLSALGVGDSRHKTSAVARFAYATVVRNVYADKLASEQALVATDLDWTIVYPVALTDATTGKPVRSVPLDEVGTIPGFPKVARSDVARTILEAVGGRWSRTTVVVTT